MHNNDWSLIFFTLLSQLSVGIIFFMLVLFICIPGAFQNLQGGGVLKSPQVVALVAIALATLISFSHLGNPSHAIYAANNFSSSWLSREILGVALFGLVVLLIFLQQWLKWSGSFLDPAMLILGSLSGIVLVFFMSKIYMINTIPAWNTWFTPFHFFMSVLVLGGMVGTGFLLRNPEALPALKIILRVLSVFLLVQILAAWLYKTQMVKIENTGIEQLDFKSGNYHALYLVRIFVLFIAALFLAYLSLKLSSIEFNYSAIIRFYVFILFLIIIEEIIGRFMFYAGYFRIGV